MWSWFHSAVWNLVRTTTTCLEIRTAGAQSNNFTASPYIGSNSTIRVIAFGGIYTYEKAYKLCTL